MLFRSPVVEMRVVDFALCGLDEIINQAAKNRYMFGGQGRVPLVARMPIGIWDASAAQHSQSLEAWFAHMPGLVVVCPSSAQDNYSLLRASLHCGDPVVYMEHKTLWGAEEEVDISLTVPLGQAARLREGRHLTLVSWSRQVQVCRQACEVLAQEGIEVDLIDLRTLWPWDRNTVLESCSRTGHLLVAHEAIQVAGFGAEIAATVAEELAIPVRRLGAPRIPVGYAPVLEAQARISVEATVQAARRAGVGGAQWCIASIQRAIATIITFSVSETKPSGTLLAGSHTDCASCASAFTILGLCCMISTLLGT
mgnify:CR=1 FL=1